MQAGLTVDALRLLVVSGSVRAAVAIGDGDGWWLKVTAISGEQSVLATDRGAARRFKTLDTLAANLRRVGIADFKVEGALWAPQKQLL